MITVGNVIEGKVINVMPFGVFVDLGDKQSGLVHISELSSGYVKDINEYIKKGDDIKVKVIKIDENGKISLSAKQAEEKKRERYDRMSSMDSRSARPVDVDWGERTSDNLSFEDKLSKFKQDSDEKMHALRKSASSKRSGGYSRKNTFSF